MKPTNTEKTKPAAAKLPRHCEQIMTNGEFCQAIALRGRKFCHAHLVHRARRIRAERRHELALRYNYEPKFMSLDIPLLEDSNAIQLALSNVAYAVMNHIIDERRAGLVLYALQSAVLNLRNGVSFRPRADAPAAESYDTLEEEIGLADAAPELWDGPPPAPANVTPNGPPAPANAAPTAPPANVVPGKPPAPAHVAPTAPDVPDEVEVSQLIALANAALRKAPQFAEPLRKPNARVRAASSAPVAALRKV